jgi:sulfofructose kinase
MNGGPCVLTVGLACADFLLYVDSLPSMPDKHRARDGQAVGGGGAANAAVAIARLGGRAVLSARLGRDRVARMVLDDLAAEGVDTSMVTEAEEGRSSFSAVLIDDIGQRQVINFRGSGLAAAPCPVTAGIDAVLTDTRWHDGAVSALEHARANGLPGVVDAEAPIDGDILARASHIGFSAQGLRSLIASKPLPDALAEVARGLGTWACVTDGEKGVWYTGKGGIEHVPAFEIRAVDSLAAGDVWHGAFTLALAEGRDEVAAIRWANAAAALKCQRPGGRDGAPARDEVDAFLKEVGA